MRVSRIFTEQPLHPGHEIELDPRAAHYVRQVLRLRRGQPIVLFNGDGIDVAAELAACDKRGCRAHIGDIVAREARPALSLHLGLGISRGERMDHAIQKSVELGVDSIAPLQTRRGEVRLADGRIGKRLTHWHGVVISACEQSGRRYLPELEPPQDLESWLGGQSRGIVLDPRAERTLPELAPPDGALSLLVGAEGGLDDGEYAAALAAGFSGVRLGPRILRTETAPLAALAAIQTLWGDFR